MNAAHDIDALCSGKELQRNFKGSDHVPLGHMLDHAAVRLRQLETYRHLQGQDGDVGKIVRPSLSRKRQGLGVNGDDHVDLAMAVAHAHQFDQMLPVFGAGVARQVQGIQRTGSLMPPRPHPALP